MSDFYDSFLTLLMGGDIDLASDDIRLLCVDAADYTLSTSTHDFLDDVPSGARVAVSAALSGKSITAGVFNFTGPTINNVTGDPFEYVITYKHTGTDATAPLICVHDSGTGLPATPNGGNITINPNSGSTKHFAIG